MKKLIVTLSMLMLIFVSISAQKKVNNTAFQAGEVLSYDLYFKIGFIDKKSGWGSLTTHSENFAGKDAYKMTFLLHTTGVARNLFELSDTLISYTDKSLTPLAFQKYAHEGNDHTWENVSYNYGAKVVNIQSKRTRNGVLKFDQALTSENFVYDFINVVYYARTIDFSKMKLGDVTQVGLISGDEIVDMLIEYRGLENIDANNDKTYSCIKLILSILTKNNKAFEDKKEAMKVFLTNDANRILVRLDTKLKMGSTRAVLKSFKGNKYPLKSMK